MSVPSATSTPSGRPHPGISSTGYAPVDAFVEKRGEDWQKLEVLLGKLDTQGPSTLTVAEVRSLGKLYRSACADLLIAQRELAEASLTDYLNGLVARAYARVYGGGQRARLNVLELLWNEFPRLVRKERKLVMLSAALFLLGALSGALVMELDPQAMGLVIPDMHQDRTPEERVRDEAFEDRKAGPAAVFSSFLFTHNIQVTFLVFALGVTFGIGTAAVLFWNGVPLGALAVQYHQSGQGLFFWAWILPHGVVELSVVVIAGAAGLLLGRGLWRPGLLSRRQALVREAKSAVRLIAGGMPLLVIAGLVEGTISQIHAPVMPYSVKLVFAATLFAALIAYLSRGGIERNRSRLSSISTE